jgi:hypothetical protein
MEHKGSLLFSQKAATGSPDRSQLDPAYTHLPHSLELWYSTAVVRVHSHVISLQLFAPKVAGV